MTTPDLRKSISRSPLRLGFLLIPLALTWFALSPTVQAQLPSPSPDGGYPNFNTAEGDNALLSLTSGSNNTAIGFSALQSNTTGLANTAVGSNAMIGSTTGGLNTAIGYQALANNNGDENTAAGSYALVNNTTGSGNTADGFQALVNNTIGGNNTASGFIALSDNTTGGGNTADGFQALNFNTIGGNNTATGGNALLSNTTGGGNTADGFQALVNNTTGSSNIALGFNAGTNLTTGSNNIDVGNNGVAGESKTIRIGTAGAQRKTFIAGISGTTVASGVSVIIASNGQLGTVVSSERFKDAIKPMDKASEAILALKPVTFRYKRELDPDGIPQFGLVAEQVEKVNPDLVARDDQGKPYTVRYDAVNVMLLNEFLKEHRTVQEEEATIRELKKDFRATVAQLITRLDEQAAQIQKVSAQFEASKPAPQMVNNP